MPDFRKFRKPDDSNEPDNNDYKGKGRKERPYVDGVIDEIDKLVDKGTLARDYKQQGGQ